MIGRFDALALRQLRARPLRALLTGFGVMLGVAMVFGVLLLVGTIRHTFDDLIDSAFGDQQVMVQPKAGTLPNSALERVRRVEGVENAAGMVGSAFKRLDSHGKPVEGLGGNMFVAGYGVFGMKPYDFKLEQGREVTFGREIILERNWARDNGVKLHQWVRVGAPSGPARLQVVGIFRFSNNLSFGGQGLAGMPIREARRLMEIPAGYQQITVSIASASDVETVRKRVQAELGAGADVKTAAGWAEEINSQLGALNVLLYFFSGIALFVGAFLILNSFNMTVLQRMREIGMLRTLGATRGMVARNVLAEAMVLAIGGTIAGLALGIGLAAGLVALMRSLGVPVGGLYVTSGAAITATITGLLVTAGAAFWPARRAARIPPVRAALGGAGLRTRASWQRGVIGIALFLPGLLLAGEFFFTDDSQGKALAAIALTITMFVGMAMVAPFVIMPIIRVLSVPLRALSPAGGRLASDSVRSNSLRTAATAAALTIGLSVVVVNSAMSSSFLGTIHDQLDQNFARDFNVQAAGFTLAQGGGPGVPANLEHQVKAMPETAVATPVRVLILKLPRSSQPGMVLGLDPKVSGQVDKTPVQGVPLSSALAAVGRGGVLVQPGYAKTAHLHRGSTLKLVGPAGARTLRVVGNLGGLGEFGGPEIHISLESMKAIYGPGAAAQLLVKARQGQAPALERRLNAFVDRRYPNLELQSAAAHKQKINDEINKQFNFFNAIVAMAVIVSLLGVVNTLAMSVIERTREIGVMRALGSSRWQVRSTMLDESLLITFAGALSGVAVGLLIGWVWVGSVGDLMPGMAFHLPVGAMTVIAVAVVIAGVMAAIVPARRAARLKVIEALTYE